ncbi:MotA/TolQ/ExbB proton channel family protein [Phaeobacter marinintestinus]|uniref:MotA/TolQ/ExbB proton channel family protein n=1 Tax=Falsiphaeobacter marinintestinus TaxID=1492905 RepID=UPI0011B77357|nr:MotA/TolQ/ExbB proton channel family protein [Phaeobacter marinintestinus]
MTKHILVAALLLAPALGLAQSVETPTAPVADLAAPQAPLRETTDGIADKTDVSPTTPSGDQPLDRPDVGDATPEPDMPQSHAEGTLTKPVGDSLQSGSISANPPLPAEDDLMDMAQDASGAALTFLRNGGPALWAIAALSVVTLALILWKTWRLALIGAWSRGKAGQAVTAVERQDPKGALAIVAGRRGIRSKVVATALTAIATLPEDRAREETARVAKREIASARVGLGALELISTIAPLLGLLGTVLGMIAAFQALQAAGSRADPALLAGGIWEALLTTAAGMAVAIPASAALTWFESVIDRIRRDIEDSATRLFIAQGSEHLRLAAE